MGSSSTPVSKRCRTDDSTRVGTVEHAAANTLTERGDAKGSDALDLDAQSLVQCRSELDCCSICLDWFHEPCVSPCGHVFCQACWNAWAASQPEPWCPTCRTAVPQSRLGVCKKLESLLACLNPTATARRRSELLAAPVVGTASLPSGMTSSAISHAASERSEASSISNLAFDDGGPSGAMAMNALRPTSFPLLSSPAAAVAAAAAAWGPHRAGQRHLACTWPSPMSCDRHPAELHRGVVTSSLHPASPAPSESSAGNQSISMSPAMQHSFQQYSSTTTAAALLSATSPSSSGPQLPHRLSIRTPRPLPEVPDEVRDAGGVAPEDTCATPAAMALNDAMNEGFRTPFRPTLPVAAAAQQQQLPRRFRRVRHIPFPSLDGVGDEAPPPAATRRALLEEFFSAQVSQLPPTGGASVDGAAARGQCPWPAQGGVPLPAPRLTDLPAFGARTSAGGVDDWVPSVSAVPMTSAPCPLTRFSGVGPTLAAAAAFRDMPDRTQSERQGVSSPRGSGSGSDDWRFSVSSGDPAALRDACVTQLLLLLGVDCRLATPHPHVVRAVRGAEAAWFMAAADEGEYLEPLKLLRCAHEVKRALGQRPFAGTSGEIAAVAADACA